MGNKVRIFQVLGNTRYLDVEYKYQNFEKEKVDFVSRYLKRKVFPESELVLFVPSSLFANYEKIENDKRKREGRLKEFKIHPIPSIGTYKFSSKFYDALDGFGFRVEYSIRDYNAKFVKFDFSPEFIYQHFLLELVNTMVEGKGFIVDVSTGHNVYVYNLMRAALKAVELYNLWTLGVGDLEFHVSFSDPVIGSELSEDSKNKVPKVHNVYLEPLTAYYFFKKPLKYDEINSVSALISESSGVPKEDLLKVLKNAVKHYNAIFFNIPIALFYLRRDSKHYVSNLIKRINNGFLQSIKNSIKLKKEDPVRLVVSSELDKRENFDAYRKVIEMLFSYLGIINLLESSGIRKKSQKEKQDGNRFEIIFSELEKLKGIYERFNLPVHWNVLLNELEKYKRCIKLLRESKKQNKSENKDKSLQECNELLNDKRDKKLRQQRNFLAHAGFEFNNTFLKKVKGKLIVSYNDKAKRLMDDVLMEKIKNKGGSKR